MGQTATGCAHDSMPASTPSRHCQKSQSAEQAVPVDEMSEELLASEIKAAEAEFQAAADDETRRVAQERLAQLVGLRETAFRT